MSGRVAYSLLYNQLSTMQGSPLRVKPWQEYANTWPAPSKAPQNCNPIIRATARHQVSRCIGSECGYRGVGASPPHLDPPPHRLVVGRLRLRCCVAPPTESHALLFTLNLLACPMSAWPAGTKPESPCLSYARLACRDQALPRGGGSQRGEAGPPPHAHHTRGR